MHKVKMKRSYQQQKRICQEFFQEIRHDIPLGFLDNIDDTEGLYFAVRSPSYSKGQKVWHLPFKPWTTVKYPENFYWEGK